MDEMSKNYSGRVDQPLAHEAGVNHVIDSASNQLKASTLRSSHFLAHSVIGDLQEKDDNNQEIEAKATQD